MTPSFALLVGSTLVHLSPVDLIIIVFYFALVLTIGLYLKEQANTGEDFFMAGREMTAGVAGLAFLSANLGRPHSGDAVPRACYDAVLPHLQDPFGARISQTALWIGGPGAFFDFVRLH